MKKFTETKRGLVDRLFEAVHRDYRECTIYMPGINDIMPGANGIKIKRLVCYDYKAGKTTRHYKLHVICIGAHAYERETTIARFEQLTPGAREQLGRFINDRCNKAIASMDEQMPATRIGHAFYITL